MEEFDIRPQFVQTVKLGLGEAIQRLISIEFQYRLGMDEDKLLDERALLFDTLNKIPLSIDFDCNGDGIPDTIEIFKQAAETSCCRLLPSDSSRGGATKTSSRKKKSEDPAKKEKAEAKTKDKESASNTDPSPKSGGDKKKTSLFGGLFNNKGE